MKWHLLWMVALLMGQAPAAEHRAASPGGVAKSAQAFKIQTALATKVTTVEGITEYSLPNGLRILLAPDDSKPTTTVNVTYKVGSRQENYGETGMAHLLEHMLFKGTPKLPGKTIVQEFARRGMRMNGSTFYDRTNYYETFAASDDNLDWALRMEADRMVNSFVARKDLDTEMTVVRNEMESGENSPFTVLWQNMAAAAYQWHNYGKSTIGARSDVENVRIENLQAFYKKYYQPDNAVLIVTGRFDEAATLARIARYFGAIPKPRRSLAPDYTREPAQDGAKEVTVSRVGDAHLLATLYHTAPGSHPDAVYLDLLSYILADTPTGRLYKALVESQKAAGVSVMPFNLKDPGYLMFLVKLSKDQSRPEVLKVLQDVVEQLAQHPVTAEELQRARTAYLNEFEKGQSDPVNFGVALSESIAIGDWRLHFLQRDLIEKATVNDLQQAAIRYLVPSNRTVGHFLPSAAPVRVEVPPAPDLERLLSGYQGKAAMTQGESFDPSPAHIGQRTMRTRLPGGLELALLPKRTRGQTVNGQIVLRMGSAASLVGQADVASAVAQMLMRGTTRMSRQQIADRLDALQSSIGISTQNGNAVTIAFESRRDKVVDMIALLKEILREPAFAADELASLRTEWLTAVESKRRQPDAVAQKALQRALSHYPKDDVRYVPTFDEKVESIQALRLDDLRLFHQRFYGAQFGQAAVVGDFDAAAVQQALAQALGDWRSAQAYERVPSEFFAQPGQSLTLQTPDKANAVFMAAMSLPIKDDDVDAPALILANRILGGGGLKNRLVDRLRQAEGISYGTGSSLQLSAWDADASFSLYAIFAPQNLGKLRSAVAEELQKWIASGVTEQELAEAKSGILQNRKISRSEDGALASGWTGLMARGRDMAHVQTQEDQLKAVTRAQVQQAIARHLDPARLVQVYAGDFAKVADKAADKVNSKP